MNCQKTCYGMTFFDKDDLKETDIEHKIELEYYATKENNKNDTQYGIEIQKKEYFNNNITMESNCMKNISSSSDKIIEIINTLKKYKVTPVGLNDVLEDLLKLN